MPNVDAPTATSSLSGAAVVSSPRAARMARWKTTCARSCPSGLSSAPGLAALGLAAPGLAAGLAALAGRHGRVGGVSALSDAGGTG